MGMGSRKGSGYVQKRRGNTTSQIRMGRDQGNQEGKHLWEGKEAWEGREGND
tara:strand:+ start:1297 stop:1452 length:156 start_codon:yes stop_codon:yes gene_type:complete